MKMKLVFCQLFLFVFIILNYCQCGNGFNFDNDENKIYRKLYDATNRTLSSILPPLCSEILFNQNNTQKKYISSGDLTGRILPSGTFTTQLLALEYLYGVLCPIPNLPPRLYTVQSFDLIRVTYDKKYLITQNYKLCGYDGQIRNFGLTLDPNTEEERRTNITLICTAAQIFCNGSLQQYASVNDCVQFLTNNVTYGSFDRADQGNVACRVLHTSFVPILPSVRCPHVGPTGGGACIDKTFDFYYSQPDFLACAHQYN